MFIKNQVLQNDTKAWFIAIDSTETQIITFIVYDDTCNPSVALQKGFDYNPITEINLRFSPHLNTSQKLLWSLMIFLSCCSDNVR